MGQSELNSGSTGLSLLADELELLLGSYKFTVDGSWFVYSYPRAAHLPADLLINTSLLFGTVCRYFGFRTLTYRSHVRGLLTELEWSNKARCTTSPRLAGVISDVAGLDSSVDHWVVIGYGAREEAFLVFRRKHV